MNYRWDLSFGSAGASRNGGVSPRSIPGLFAWFDGADPQGDGTLPADGTAISQWIDKSGNSRSTNAQVGAARPTIAYNQLNGRPALAFVSASSQTFALPSTYYSIANGDNTSFSVVKRTNESGVFVMRYCLSEGGNTTTEARRYGNFGSGAGAVAFRSGTALSPSVFTTGGVNTNFQIITEFRSGTTQSVQINDLTPVTDTNGASESGVDRAYIGSLGGASNFLNGQYAELIEYSRALTTAEILLVKAYLRTKWGLP